MSEYSYIHTPVSYEGPIKEGIIFSILYYFYKKSISGTLVVQGENCEKKMFIEHKKIVFAASNGREDAFGSYLLKNELIDNDIFQKTSQYMSNKDRRFGRALIELGYFNYEQIWTWVPNHLKSIVFSFFDIQSGTYRILIEQNHEKENIVLDMDILSIILEGIRRLKSRQFVEKIFENIKELYVIDSKTISQLDLKPYEIHVFDLVRRGNELKDILKRSELLEFDTLRLLYLFLVLEIISPQKPAEKVKISSDNEPLSAVNTSTFHSFEEALRYYNMKYELIYKVMLKEIGPIALSLLLKAVEDIMDNLPTYFRKIQLNPDGSINGETLLKSVWYYDFDQYIGEFLRGLEEILYTEIYAVKKHLGVDYEQQVLKWINGIGS